MRYIRDFAADVVARAEEPVSPPSRRGGSCSARARPTTPRRARASSRTSSSTPSASIASSRACLELSRIDSSQAPMEPFDLEVPGPARRRAHAHRRSSRSSWTGAPHQALARPRRRRERALLNLVENAPASPRGRAVRVTVACSRDGRELRLVVRDRGPGVPKELERKIFDRFFTTDADKNGTGLGLAIVASVAEAHGGRVELEPGPGEGATFTLVLRGDA
ncbi:MAG: sensor histidine kinase [Sandaracinaceae bacterium]|nr:sensor histidine kinase [Sandaracinaceae bacterium]